MGPDRVPDVPVGSFGVGLDLPWGQPIGLVRDPDGDRPSPRVLRFFERYATHFDAAFVSWQARGRGRLDPADYVEAWDTLWDACPVACRGLHHTALNLATATPYERESLLAFTEALIARYDLRWVNEDLGLWSLGGKPLPYPLPPFLTDDGLEACVRNVADVQGRLSVPLVVEFPGFSEGISLCIGDWDAYDFFRALMERTGSPCTLDVGHLLSWRWLQGHRGPALLDELQRLPLDHCVELHLSGCAVAGDRWIDAHHGVLRPEQLAMLEQLIPRCPQLRLITYEDPRFGADGRLLERTRTSFEGLCEAVVDWRRAA